MFRRSLFCMAVGASLLPLTPAIAQSSTIRVEPRPYYGAVVTLEQGVRVWRPLPPTSHMIINPTGAPVHVNVTDVRETINHSQPVNNYAGTAPYMAGGNGYVGAPGYFVGRHFHGHRGHHPHRKSSGWHGGRR